MTGDGGAPTREERLRGSGPLPGAMPRPAASMWSTVLVLAFAHFINDLYAAFLAPLLPLVVTKFSLSLAMAGLLGTVFHISAAFGQPFFGLAADRISRPVFSIAGPTLTALMMGVLGFAPSYAVMLLVLIGAGIGIASFHPQSFAVAGSVSGDRRGMGLSVFVAGGELGYALGPLYVAAVVEAFGLQGTAAAALPGLAACGLIWWSARSWQVAGGRPAGGLRSDFREHGRSLALIWLIVVLRSVIILSHILFLPLLLRERGQSLIVGGVAIFLFGGVGALGGLIGGHLSDRIGRRAVMAASLVLGAPLLLLFGVSRSVWGLLPLALGGMAIYLSAPVSVVMAQEMLPGRASLVSSLVTGMAWGTAGLSLTLVGAVADRIGLSAALMATVALVLPALAAVWALPRLRVPATLR